MSYNCNFFIGADALLGPLCLIGNERAKWVMPNFRFRVKIILFDRNTHCTHTIPPTPCPIRANGQMVYYIRMYIGEEKCWEFSLNGKCRAQQTIIFSKIFYSKLMHNIPKHQVYQKCATINKTDERGDDPWESEIPSEQILTI